MSNNFKNNNIWNDNNLKEIIDKINQSVFDIICQNAKNLTIFNNIHSLTYHGNSDKTKK